MQIWTLLGLALAAEAAEEPSDVVVLTDDSFKNFIDENPVTLVEFYAPWCGHCKALKPEYEKAATELLKLKEPIKIAKVDCTAQEKTCAEFKVEGFPTLKIFKSGRPLEYKGQRTAESIVQTVKKAALPPVTVLEAKDFDAFKDSAKVVIVGFFDGKNKKDLETFTAVAAASDHVFGSISDASVLKENDVTAPGIILYKTFDEKKNVYSGDFSKDSIAKFIADNSVPVMDEIGPDNYEVYVKRGLPIGFFFYGSKEQREKYGPIFEKLAKKHRDSVSVVYLDAEKFGMHAQNIALKEEWPAFGFQIQQKKYPLDQSKEFSEKNIKQFIEDFVAGKVQPTTKSEDIPETNDGPVTVVVGKSFVDIVLDKTKDVFIELYAPWCGHCKALAPTWDKLGEALKGTSILVAKMDATANDLPASVDLEIQGFPTLVLFKANSKEHVSFNGERDIASFKAFLKANAVHADQVTEDEEPEEGDKEEKEEEEERDEL